MTTIRNLISIWMLTLTGSLLLPMASFATVSGTTHDLPSVSTTMQVSLPTCTTVGEEQYAAVGLRSMASHQVWSLFGVSRILNAPKNADDFFDGTKYTDKVKQQMQQGDLHSFPESVTGFQNAGKVTPLKGGDGVIRQKLEIPGGYKGREGDFEFIKEPDGSINHRFFRESTQ